MTNPVKTAEERVVEEYNTLKSSYTDQYVISNFLSKIIKNVTNDKELSSPLKPGYMMKIDSTVDPFLFATFLTSQGASVNLRSVFNTFNNAQLSSLIPEIKMSVRNRTAKSEYDIKPIPLQNLQPEFTVLESPEVRGATLGLKTIDFDLGGTSPETAVNDINATAVFYGNTLGVFQEHPEYVDLIVPHFQKKDGTESEMLFQVGWSEVLDPTEALKFTDAQKNAIKAQFQTFVMNYVSHTFNFNQDGSFILQVEYVSYIDGVIRDANLLDEGITDTQDVYQKELPPPPKKLEAKDHQKVMDYIKKNHAGVSSNDKKAIYNAIAENGKVDANISRLEQKLLSRSSKKFIEFFDSIPYQTYHIPITKMNVSLLRRAIKRVYGLSIDIDKEIKTILFRNGKNNNNVIRDRDFLTFEQSVDLKQSIAIAGLAGQSVTAGKINKIVDPALASFNLNPLKSSIDPEPGLKFVNVTTFGKVIETFVEKSKSVKNLMSEKDIRIVFGTIKIVDDGDLNGKIYSLYDLPVAEQTIREVVREVYVSKLRSKVSLKVFLSAMTRRMIENYLQGDLVLDAGKKLSANTFRSVQVSCSRKSRDKLNKATSRTLKEGIRSDVRKIDKTKLANLYCIMAGPASDDPDASLDEYHIGAANSIVKKVNFTQANSSTMQARKDDNIVAAFRDGSNLGVLPQLYNTKIDVIGNLNFYPGYVFNLTPTVLGINKNLKDSILKDLGLIGSYMTLKVNHSFSRDGFTTSLEAYNIATEKYINKTVKDNKKK